MGEMDLVRVLVWRVDRGGARAGRQVLETGTEVVCLAGGLDRQADCLGGRQKEVGMEVLTGCGLAPGVWEEECRFRMGRDLSWVCWELDLWISREAPTCRDSSDGDQAGWRFSWRHEPCGLRIGDGMGWVGLDRNQMGGLGRVALRRVGANGPSTTEREGGTEGGREGWVALSGPPHVQLRHGHDTTGETQARIFLPQARQSNLPG